VTPPINLEIAGNSIGARDPMLAPNHTVCLAKAWTIGEPPALVMRLVGSL